MRLSCLVLTEDQTPGHMHGPRTCGPSKLGKGNRTPFWEQTQIWCQYDPPLWGINYALTYHRNSHFLIRHQCLNWFLYLLVLQGMRTTNLNKSYPVVLHFFFSEIAKSSSSIYWKNPSNFLLKYAIVSLPSDNEGEIIRSASLLHCWRSLIPCLGCWVCEFYFSTKCYLKLASLSLQEADIFILLKSKVY